MALLMPESVRGVVAGAELRMIRLQWAMHRMMARLSVEIVSRRA